MGSIFLLESKQKCLFCREKVGGNSINAATEDHSTESDNIPDYDEDNKKYSLRHICHYLKEALNHKVLIFREGEKTTSYSRSKGYQITLCRKCSVVVERLTNLCQELELIQMKIDHAVKEMIQIISTTPPSVKEDGNGEAVTFESLLREKTRKLSISKLQKSRHPRIKLFKFDRKVDKETPEVPWQSMSLTVSNEEPPQEDPKLEKAENSKFEKILKYQPSCSNVSMSSNVDNTGKEIQCPFCSCSLLDSNRLRFHTLTIHPEQFFSNEQIKGVSQDQFQSACHQLLTQETQSRSSNGFYQCRHCLISKKERRRLITHMVDSHYDTLVKELNSLQQNGGWQIEEPGTVDVGEEAGRFHLEGIGEKGKTDNRAHPVVTEIMQRLTCNKLEEHDVFTCQLCVTAPRTFSRIKGLELHAMCNHAEHFFESFRKPSITTELFKTSCESMLENLVVKPPGRHLSFCPFCNCGFSELRALKRHLIRLHYNILGKKLEETLEQIHGMTESEATKILQAAPQSGTNYSLPCKICGVEFSSRVALAGHMSRMHSLKTVINQAKVQNGPKCVHCNRSFTSSANLTRHLKTSCDKLRKIGALHPIAHKCHLCTATFSSIFSLSLHMKQRHSERFRPACSYCGMDFSSNQNMKRHMRLYCEKMKELGLLPNKNAMAANASSSLLAALLQSGNVEFETGEESVLRLHSVAENDVEHDNDIEMDVKEEPTVHEEVDYSTNTFSLLSSIDMEQVEVCDKETLNFYNESEESGQVDYQMGLVEDDPLKI